MRVALVVVLLLFAGCGDDDAMDGSDAGTDAAHDSSTDAHLDTLAMDASDASDVTDAIDATDASDATDLDEIERRVLDLDGDARRAWLNSEACAGRGPWRAGDEALFVYLGEGARVSVVGEANEWNPDADPMREAAPGVFVARTTWSTGLFKFWVDGEFVAPDSALFGFDEFGEHGFVARPSGVHFQRCVLDTTVGARRVRVRVPATVAYDTRVLLLHDGQNVFGEDAPWGGWRVEVALAESYDDVLAIAVDHGPDRFADYTHTSDELAGEARGGRADAYLDALRHDVLPWVRSAFGVGATPLRTTMMGSSLGGLVSVYAGLARLRLASYVAALSPTLGWGAYVEGESYALVSRLESVPSVAFYLDSGGGGTCVDHDGDGVMEDADDSDNYCVTNQFRDRLAELGHVFDDNLFHWHEPGAMHNEAAWRARVPRALAACESAGWR